MSTVPRRDTLVVFCGLHFRQPGVDEINNPCVVNDRLLHSIKNAFKSFMNTWSARYTELHISISSPNVGYTFNVSMCLFTQPPTRRMRICFTDVFLFFFAFCSFLLFPFATKIPDNRSRERLNGFSWNFYQTIAGKMEFASSYPNGG